MIHTILLLCSIIYSSILFILFRFNYITILQYITKNKGEIIMIMITKEKLDSFLSFVTLFIINNIFYKDKYLINASS
jgi:hypothetical protein